MILPGRGMESRSREEWKSPICYSGEGIQPAWGNQAMANVKRETIRITVPFGVLIALLCEEAFRVVSRDQEAYRLVSCMLPGFLARHGRCRLAS